MAVLPDRAVDLQRVLLPQESAATVCLDHGVQVTAVEVLEGFDLELEREHGRQQGVVG